MMGDCVYGNIFVYTSSNLISCGNKGNSSDWVGTWIEIILQRNIMKKIMLLDFFFLNKFILLR